MENEAFGIESCGKVLRRSEGIKGYINERGGREIVSIIGPSGSGKSTLLRCATMLETMDRGEVVYLGKRRYGEMIPVPFSMHLLQN